MIKNTHLIKFFLGYISSVGIVSVAYFASEYYFRNPFWLFASFFIIPLYLLFLYWLWKIPTVVFYIAVACIVFVSTPLKEILISLYPLWAILGSICIIYELIEELLLRSMEKDDSFPNRRGTIWKRKMLQIFRIIIGMVFFSVTYFLMFGEGIVPCEHWVEPLAMPEEVLKGAMISFKIPLSVVKLSYGGCGFRGTDANGYIVENNKNDQWLISADEKIRDISATEKFTLVGHFNHATSILAGGRTGTFNEQYLVSNTHGMRYIIDPEVFAGKYGETVIRAVWEKDGIIIGNVVIPNCETIERDSPCPSEEIKPGPRLSDYLNFLAYVYRKDSYKTYNFSVDCENIPPTNHILFTKHESWGPCIEPGGCFWNTRFMDTGYFESETSQGVRVLDFGDVSVTRFETIINETIPQNKTCKPSGMVMDYSVNYHIFSRKSGIERFMCDEDMDGVNSFMRDGADNAERKGLVKRKLGQVKVFSKICTFYY